MTPLRPVLDTHLAAGQKAFDSIRSWRDTIESLDEMAIRFPGHDIHSCLLKVAALNSLLGANVPYVWDMAEHVSQVMIDPNRGEGPRLVEQLSRPVKEPHLKAYRSFASKYSHFFIDSQMYPIYDVHVRTAIAHHMGDRRIDLPDYFEFYERFRCLQTQREPKANLRALDRYLWVAGQSRLWQTERQKSLSKDVQAFFANSDSTLVQTLQDALP